MDIIRSEAYEAQLEKILRSDRIFPQLSEEIVQELIRRAQFVVYQSGELIIRQGDPPDGFYIILEGSVRVYDESQNKQPDRLNHMRPGDIFGEMGMLNNQPRAASVHPLEETLVARFDRDTWDWLINLAPHLLEGFEERTKGYKRYTTAPYPNSQISPEILQDKASSQLPAYMAGSVALGEKLRVLRKAANLTQQGLAERLGEVGVTLHRRDISKYETGSRTPSRAQLYDLLRALARIDLIHTQAEADELLEAAGHAPLSADEVASIFQGEMAETQRRLDITIRALSDAPTVNDLLGFKVYAEALAKFIEDPETEKPLTIAIDAPWGMGKSSLMRMIEQRLARPGQGEINTGGQGRKVDKQHRQLACPAVWFNAWQYDQSEVIWANLVLEILKQVQARMSFWQRLGLTLSLTRRRFDLEALIQTIVRYLLVYALPILLIGLTLVVIASLYLGPTVPEVIEQTRLYIAAVGWGVVLSLIFAVGKEAYDKLTQPLSLKLEEYIRQPDYLEKAGFLTQFREDFRRVVEVVTKTRQGRWPLVIFIDDLDRCEPPKPVDIIEAINLLLDSKYCVFIIGMDSRTVAGSIEAKYKDMLAHLEQSDASGNLTFGQQFLEKIVQVRFRIPRPDQTTFQNFIDNHLTLIEAAGQPAPSPAEADFEQKVDQATALLKAAQREQTQPVTEAAQAVKRETILPPAVIDAAQARVRSDRELFDINPVVQRTIREAAYYFGLNPRQVKRFINLYRLQTYIVQQRGLLDKAGFELDLLGKWLVLGMGWPRVATAVRREREFFDRFETAAKLKKDLDGVSPAVETYEADKAILDRYLADKLLAASVDDNHLRRLLVELKNTENIRQYLDLTEISLSPEVEATQPPVQEMTKHQSSPLQN